MIDLSVVVRDEDERALLQGRLDRSVKGLGCRAAFMATAPLIIDAIDSSRLGEFEALRATLPKHPPFSMAPLDDLVLLYCYAARLLYPEEAIDARLERITAEGFEQFAEVSVLKPVFMAADGNVQSFLALFSSMISNIFSAGYIDHVAETPTRSRLYCDDFSVELLNPLLKGFITGVVCKFCGCHDRSQEASGAGVSVEFELHSPTSGEYLVQW